MTSTSDLKQTRSAKPADAKADAPAAAAGQRQVRRPTPGRVVAGPLDAKAAAKVEADAAAAAADPANMSTAAAFDAGVAEAVDGDSDDSDTKEAKAAKAEAEDASGEAFESGKASAAAEAKDEKAAGKAAMKALAPPPKLEVAPDEEAHAKLVAAARTQGTPVDGSA